MIKSILFLIVFTIFSAHTSKIVIIGAGAAGEKIGILVAQKQLGDLVLIDTVPDMAKYKAMELGWVTGAHVIGTEDYAALKDADVVVISFATQSHKKMSLEEVIPHHQKLILKAAEAVKTYCPNAFVIVLTTPAIPLANLFQSVSHVKKIIGISVSHLVAHAASDSLSKHFGVSSQDINITFIGSGHFSDVFPLWRYSSIKGISLTALIENGSITLEKLTSLIKKNEEELKLKQKSEKERSPNHKHLCLSVAQLVGNIIESYLKDSKRVFVVGTKLQGEYGAQDIYMGVPVVIGKNGVEKIMDLPLDSEEKKLFDKNLAAAKILQDKVKG